MPKIKVKDQTDEAGEHKQTYGQRDELTLPSTLLVSPGFIVS